MIGVFLRFLRQSIRDYKVYKFDHHLEARSVIKERFVWMLYMGVLFFLLYGASNQYAGITAPHPSYWLTWEKQIPFIEPFIVPYMSSDVMFIIAFFLPYTRLELRILAARILFIVGVACAIFALFPLQFSFTKPPVGSFNILFSMLEADLPFNQLPSLHIAFSIVLWFSMRKYLKNKWIKIIVAVWLWLIALSTLFVYQHHFIDLPTGALLGIVAVYVIREDKQSILSHSFSTPRSLKMALYYILAAAACMILSFIFSSLISWICLWLFFSLFGVSIVYAFGLNTLLAGKEAKASWWQWILFAPYFVGNYLSWQYYKCKLPLMHVLKENVYIGRYPSAKEYSALEEQGICLVLNLATEQQVQKKGLPQIRLPFLDQTIQSPESLHEGVQYIEAHKNDGVYVHCTLGLSRSVLLVSAWLLFHGYSLEDVHEEIAKVRPQYVKSVYMQITLEIYQKYLNSLGNE